MKNSYYHESEHLKRIVTILLTLTVGLLSEVTDWCPIYDDPFWKEYAMELQCEYGFVFHCARLYNTSTLVKICARSKYCPIGKEPWVNFFEGDTKYGQVTCEYCFNHERTYNPNNWTLSSKMSKCPKLKERCSNWGLIECPRANELDKYTKNRECRCDARNSYVPYCITSCKGLEKGPCTSENEMQQCYYEPCPDGQERLIKNYSCVAVCENGYRPDDSDNCTREDLSTNSSTSQSPTVRNQSISVTTMNTVFTKISVTDHAISTNEPSSTPLLSTTISVTSDGLGGYRIVIIITAVFGSFSMLIILAVAVHCILKHYVPGYIEARRRLLSILMEAKPIQPKDTDDSDSIASSSSIEMNLLSKDNRVPDQYKNELAEMVMDNCSSNIIDKMEPRAVVNKLLSNNVISYETYKSILENIKSSKMNSELFMALRDNLTVEKYDVFKKVLKYEKHDAIIEDMLEKENNLINQYTGNFYNAPAQSSSNTPVDRGHDNLRTVAEPQNGHGERVDTSGTQNNSIVITTAVIHPQNVDTEKANESDAAELPLLPKLGQQETSV